ncbi:MAG: single-stranded-DNA-specific exonuclease RecJ [Burkholderiaceae bacterium]|nr:single-stranded-DNA-specific exonuclease RecJ [Burkholderiaceae bacterium]MEB2319398.1 single-stranded-DNA-specific exonuclease RecJ [Pseudomonadota bacterium]
MTRSRLLRQREVDPRIAESLARRGVHPVLCRILASRGLRDAAELDTAIAGLAAPESLADGRRAAALLADAIAAGERICVVADYDCDGATACAVAVRGLRRFGATVDYLVPNRFVHGYGLGPAVVELASRHPRLGRPDWLLTVDNGIASIEGVEAAHRAGMKVIVTDHHLPGPTLPAAAAIVNPNRRDCAFPSKHLAGVGVVFYLLGMLRSQLGATAGRARVELVDLLDLVAVGTVADVVRLDPNNRRLVAAGLRRIRAGLACPGLAALLQVAGIEPARASVRDIGFGIAPRINAAGRLAEISTGIECLLADDPAHAARLAAELDAINRERRRIEQDMRAQALADIGAPDAGAPALVICRDDWHEGVVGLVAGRLKDLHWRPAIALAPARGEPGMLRGSGRSVPGLHLRDALETVANRHPGMIERYGGHAMAAGLSLAAANLAGFTSALHEAIIELADEHAFDEILLHDGPLAPAEIDFGLLDAIDAGIWGQGFPAPLFVNRFRVDRQRVVGDGHLKLSLRLGERGFDAIAFGRSAFVGEQARLAYRLERNDWQGRQALQLVVEDIDDGDAPI